jgi:cytochrome c oxidase assembly factor CtaG
VIAHSPSVGELLRTWQPQAGPIALIVIATGLYLTGVARVRRWPRGRTLAFIGGMAAIAIALLSGIDAFADDLLSVHMVEHMLLTLVAAPLILLGAPLTLALRATRGTTRAGIAALLRSRPVNVLSRPLVAFAPFPIALLATHLTPFYDFTLRHAWAHELEHAVYLATALLLFAPVIASEPLPHKLSGLARSAYLLAGMVPMSIVSAVLMSGDSARYPTYARITPRLGSSALSDQRLGAAIMWVGGGLVMAAIAVVMAWRAWDEEERRTRARERYADARLEVSS